MENWMTVALLIVLVLILVWFTKSEEKEALDTNIDDGLLERKHCPNNMMGTLDGPCLNLQDPALYQEATTKDFFMPHRRWSRMYPGGPIYAEEDGPIPYPNRQWNLFSYSYPEFECAQSCYGVPYKFECLQNCRARYGY